jgi:GAF domain-containing protein
MTGSLDVDRLWRVIDVSRHVLAELDLEAVLNRVLDTAREIAGARFAALGVLDDSRSQLDRFIVRGLDQRAQREIGELPRGRGVLGVLISDPVPLRLADVGEHPYSYGFAGGHPEMRSFLGVPILVRGEPWGNLYLAEKDGGCEFDQADEEAVVLLASWAAIAIEHARLFGAAARRGEGLERSARALEASQAIALAVSGEADLVHVLELIAKRGRALVGAHSVMIFLREGDELAVAACAGESERAVCRCVSVEGSALGEVLLAGRPERIADLSSRSSMSSQGLRVGDAQTALLVPMVWRGSGLGVLAAFDPTSKETAFSDENEQALRAFAATAATAVATARLAA